MLTEAQKTLVEDNHKLIFGYLNSNNLPKDEFYDLAAIGLCKAAQSYKEGELKFSTFAYIHIKREINTYFKKSKAYKRKNLIDAIPIKDSLFNSLCINNHFENDTIFKITLNDILKKLNPLELKIINLIFEGYRQNEICDILNCDNWKISYTKKKVINSCLA